jgi:hypothetical protein
VQASVEQTCLPATKFTKECGYNAKPGDTVSIARGPEFHTKGVVSAVDFIKAQLMLKTDGDHSSVSLIEFSLVNLSYSLQITVPIRFVYWQ